MRRKYPKPLLGFLAVLFLLGATIFLQACSKKEEELPEKAESETKMETIEFKMPETCRGCHPVIFAEWEASLHRIAFIDPLYWAEAELAGKEAGAEVRDFCHSCHAAAASMVEKIPADATKASPLAKAGVPCDLCHSITEVKKIGNRNIVVETASNTKRGPYKDSFSPYHLTEYSEIHTKAEFCAACHNVYHPANGLPIEKPYDEWKEGPYAKDGIVCQDCHMTPGPQVVKPNPGQVAVGGPMREHYYTHSTIGGNAFITQYMGIEKGYQIAVERLKSAARLEIEDFSLSGSNASLKVKVTNVGAGHYLPTGLTVMRQMWLHVVVKDASGKVLFESGQLDGEGNIDEKAVIYHTVYADKNGNPTEKVWEAEKILKDYRIPPKESVTETFSFILPAGIKRPLSISVELLYRSAPQHIVNKLMKDRPEVPVIQMAAVEKSF